MASGRWQSAIAEFEIIRARTGNRDAALLNNLAWASFKAGETQKASSYAMAAYALMPNNAAVAATRGWILYESGERRVSLGLLIKAQKLAPNDAFIRRQLEQARL